MGGVFQAAVSTAKCLPELHTWKALRQSLISAKSTSRDVRGMLQAGSKAGVETPSAPQPCAAVSTLFPPRWHNGWWIIFNPDHFNMVPVNCSCGDDWGTEELDGGFPAGCAAIPSPVTIPSKLTQTSLHISSVKSVKNYFHSEIHTQLLVRCSRKHQATASSILCMEPHMSALPLSACISSVWFTWYCPPNDTTLLSIQHAIFHEGHCFPHYHWSWFLE